MAWAHVDGNNGLMFSVYRKSDKVYQEVNFDDFCRSVEARQYGGKIKKTAKKGMARTKD